VTNCAYKQTHQIIGENLYIGRHSKVKISANDIDGPIYRSVSIYDTHSYASSQSLIFTIQCKVLYSLILILNDRKHKIESHIKNRSFYNHIK